MTVLSTLIAKTLVKSSRLAIKNELTQSERVKGRERSKKWHQRNIRQQGLPPFWKCVSWRGVRNGGLLSAVRSQRVRVKGNEMRGMRSGRGGGVGREEDHTR